MKEYIQHQVQQSRTISRASKPSNQLSLKETIQNYKDRRIEHVSVQNKTTGVIQQIREKNEGETTAKYVQYLKKEASKLQNNAGIIIQKDVDAGGGTIENVLYLRECMKSVSIAIKNELYLIKNELYLKEAIIELEKAINIPTYFGEIELQGYSYDKLLGEKASLKEKDEKLIKERIDAMNTRRRGFHLHIGVGDVPTMDVTGLSFGSGTGRGNARLQFLKDGTMRLVGHDNQSLI